MRKTKRRKKEDDDYDDNDEKNINIRRCNKSRNSSSGKESRFTSAINSTINIICTVAWYLQCLIILTTNGEYLH